MDTAPETSRGALGAGRLLFAGLLGAALFAAAFAGDGSDVDGVLPVGGAAVALLAVALVLVAAGRLPLPRLGLSGAALLATTTALVVWLAATIAWSVVPDQSWDSVNRSVAYVAFLGLGIVLAATVGRVAARVGALLLTALTGVVVTWALLAKTIPSLDPGGDRIGRLREPVEYWNALALLADVAIVLGLWLALAWRPPMGRVTGALLVYGGTIVALLTLSRAGIIAGAIVIAPWLALIHERLASGLLLVASAGPGAAVAGWAFTRPALVEDGARRSDRVDDGAVFGLLAFVGGLLVVALVVLAGRRTLDAEGRRRASRLLATAGVLAVAAALGVFGVAVGNAVTGGSSCAEVENDPSRLASLDPNNRWCWWNEAWDVFGDNAPEGAGAGSFEVARKRYRIDARNVIQPHSVPLQQLADGGVVAFLLYLGLLGAGGAVAVCALRRLSGPERLAATALVAAPAAYAIHSFVDYDWDFLAVTAPTMVALGVLAGAGRPAGRVVRSPLLGVGAVLVGLAILASFTAPRLAERSVRASTRALDRGDFEKARDRAERAHTLNPLSIDPLLALARIDARGQDLDRAQERYVQAVELQPENPRAWYALGLFEFQTLGRMCSAYEFLNESYTRDPAGNQWTRDGPLDIARDAVNDGACEPS